MTDPITHLTIPGWCKEPESPARRPCQNRTRSSKTSLARYMNEDTGAKAARKCWRHKRNRLKNSADMNIARFDPFSRRPLKSRNV